MPALDQHIKRLQNLPPFLGGKLLDLRQTAPQGNRLPQTHRNVHAAGNLTSYVPNNFDGPAYNNTHSYTHAKSEGYKEAAINATSTSFKPGSSTSNYDANGYHTSHTDSTRPAEKQRGSI